ncbi:MAG: TolC family protein [Phycisphaerales bacterium]|nr:TolC family protein [Phycisphaerales bacterium]
MTHTRTRAAVALASLLPLLPGGCTSNPFGKDPLDKHTIAGPERLRSINALILEQREYAPEQQPTAEESLQNARDRFAGVERVELSLDNARIAAIANNLNLSATLISPTIAAEQVSEEEARFESVFTLSASVRDNDDAVASALDSSQSTSRSITPGIRVPLRTGGELSINLPISRFETDNSFSLLNPAYTSDLNFSLSQNLLRGAGRRAATHSIRLAEYNRQISEAQTKLEVIRTLAEVDRAYWRLYAAIRALEVVEQQYKVAQAQFDRAGRKERAGTGTEVDIVRAQSGLADRAEQIIRAQNDVSLQERALKALLNIDGLDVDSATHLEPASPPDPVEYAFDAPHLVRAALDNRMELLELELNLARDAANIAFAENQALPLVALQYTYGINGLGGTLDNSIDTLGRNNFESWSIGLNAEIPIGNEQRKSSLAQSILTRLQTLATRDAREQAITREVYDAIDQLNSTWNRIIAAQQAVELNARVLEAEQRQFDVGRSTTTDVLDADVNLANARLSEIQAIVEYQVAQIDLAFATGTLLGQTKVDWVPRDPRGGDGEARAREGVTPYRPASGILVSP